MQREGHWRRQQLLAGMINRVVNLYLCQNCKKVTKIVRISFKTVYDCGMLKVFGLKEGLGPKRLLHTRT